MHRQVCEAMRRGSNGFRAVVFDLDPSCYKGLFRLARDLMVVTARRPLFDTCSVCPLCSFLSPLPSPPARRARRWSQSVRWMSVVNAAQTKEARSETES